MDLAAPQVIDAFVCFFRVGGSSETRIYTVVFKGYDTTELVSASEIRPLTDHKKRNLQDSTEHDSDKDRKRKKNEKKTENKAAKAAEQLEKQKSWQSFAKKSVKKGVHIPGIVSSLMTFASHVHRHLIISHVSSRSATRCLHHPTILSGRVSSIAHLYFLSSTSFLLESIIHLDLVRVSQDSCLHLTFRA